MVSRAGGSFPTPFTLHTARVSGLSREEIEEICTAFVAHHYPCNLQRPTQLDAIHLFEEVLPSLGANIAVVDDLESGIEAFTCPVTRRVVLSEATYQSAYHRQGRGIFTIAHETFHWLQHVEQFEYLGVRATLVQGQYRARMARAVMNVPAYEDPEWQANRGGACIAIPEPPLRMVLREHGPSPRAVQRAFGVSFPCARRRVEYYVKYCKEVGIWLPYE